MFRKIEEAKRLADAGHVDDAFEILEDVLTKDPDNGPALAMGSYIAEKADRFPMAYLFARRASEVAPDKAMPWEMLGITCDVLGRFDEGEKAYRKAIQLSKTAELKGLNYANLSSLFINSGRFKEAKPICEAALKLNPNHWRVKSNYGICLLGLNDWSGWDYYSNLWGTPKRPKKRWKAEPDWDGTKGQKIIVYSEQGLGDEICFSSMIPDVSIDCDVVFECDLRLSNLFERSFPKVKVYGTRYHKKPWDSGDALVEASISSGELGRFYRRSDDSFSKEPFLKACPYRKTMWRALFDAKKKPVIGIAWTGGTQRTNAKFRELSLEALDPILKSVDAHWVSLEYRNSFNEVSAAKERGIDIEQYPFATLTPDYDDTAALVDECDLVICMQTAVAHLAAGLGKDVWTLVPKTTGWRYGEEGDSCIWYPTMKLVRENDGWGGAINQVVKMLNDRYTVRRAA